MKFLLFLLLLVLTGTQQLADNSGTLRIAVASNFITTARQLVAAYQTQSTQKIVLSPGSTGKLTTQIRYGAPYDLFLSADTKHPEKLIAQGLASSESLQAYAIGQLVLISRVSLDTPEQLSSIKIPLQIAIANPAIAPYGAAGKYWLDKQTINLQQHTLIKGENINQTWHYFINGGADMALVALSQILSQAQLSFNYWTLETPAKQLIQSAVLLKQSEQQQAARDFLGFLHTEEAIKIIQQTGYKLPI